MFLRRKVSQVWPMRNVGGRAEDDVVDLADVRPPPLFTDVAVCRRCKQPVAPVSFAVRGVKVEGRWRCQVRHVRATKLSRCENYKQFMAATFPKFSGEENDTFWAAVNQDGSKSALECVIQAAEKAHSPHSYWLAIRHPIANLQMPQPNPGPRPRPVGAHLFVLGTLGPISQQCSVT